MKTLGIFILTLLMASPAMAMEASTEDLTPKTKRKVVRVVVTDSNIKANFQPSQQRHLTRVYAPQSASAKVIKPKAGTNGMPNLYKK